MLLFALLFSACARVAKRMEGGAPEEEASIESAYPFTDFPPGTSKQGAANGQVTPNRAEGTLFNAKFEGDAVSGSGGAVGGTYHFIATETDGESWHVKLEANYPTVAGRDYTVTYRFTSDVSGTVKFGDFQEFQIQEGENTVTGTFTAKDSTSYLDLQLGMLQPFTIDFTEIEVMEYADDVDYVNALPKPVDFTRESKVYERHDQGYETVLVREPHAINVNYEAIPTDTGVWKSRLYVRTGLVPEPGTHYRVTFDVMSDRYERPITFEVLLNDGDVEKGLGGIFGLTSLPSGQYVEFVTYADKDARLVVQVSLGNSPAPNTIFVSDVKVEKAGDINLVSDTIYTF